MMNVSASASVSDVFFYFCNPCLYICWRLFVCAWRFFFYQTGWRLKGHYDNLPSLAAFYQHHLTHTSSIRCDANTHFNTLCVCVCPRMHTRKRGEIMPFREV